MTNISQRSSGFLYFISYLQIIGIILVVFGHSMHQYDEALGFDLLIYRMMYSFRMPLFLFVSGFLMIYTTVKVGKYPSFCAFVAKKFKRLIIPLFVVMTFAYIPRALMNGLADDAVEVSWSAYLSMFLHSNDFVIPFYWFLYTSFTLLVVTYATVLISRRYNINLPGSLAALAVFFAALYFAHVLEGEDFLSIGNTIMRGAYFVAGAIYCYYHDAIDAKFGRVLSSSWFFVACAACWALLFFAFEDTTLIMLCSFAGIAMSVSLAKILVAKHITTLNHLRGSTYMIFLLSWFFNIASQQVLAHFTDFPWWVYSSLSLLTGVYGPWVIYKLLKRYKTHSTSQVVSFLLGQNTSVS